MSERRGWWQPMARLATEKEASDYIGLDLATFRIWVEGGRLPKALVDCGKFDLKALTQRLTASQAWAAQATRSMFGCGRRPRGGKHAGQA